MQIKDAMLAALDAIAHLPLSPQWAPAKANRLHNHSRRFGAPITRKILPLPMFALKRRAVRRESLEKEVEAVKRILQTALNAQVLTETIIPLPVLGAEEALKQAETLAEKKEDTKEDNTAREASLDKARGQLELAQALGYGTKKNLAAIASRE